MVILLRVLLIPLLSSLITVYCLVIHQQNIYECLIHCRESSAHTFCLMMIDVLLWWSLITKVQGHQFCCKIFISCCWLFGRGGNWGACLLVSQVFKVPSNFKSSKTFNSFLHTKVWWKEYKRDIQMNESLNFGSFWLRKCFSWASICESAKYNCGHILIGSMSFQKSNFCDPALWPFQ